MEDNIKDKKIEARVTKKEKENIKKIAEEKGMSVSSLILNSIENNITVNLDTSDYKDLVIQFRRIGNNVNTILKRLNATNHFEESDLNRIQILQRDLQEELRKEKRNINRLKRSIEDFSPDQIKNYLEEEEMRIPDYLIYDEIAYQINYKLEEFIKLMKEQEANPIFKKFILAFLRDFSPTDYEYDELVSLSNELSKVIYKTNQKIITKSGEFVEDDFSNIVEIVNKYRKDRG